MRIDIPRAHLPVEDRVGRNDPASPLNILGRQRRKRRRQGNILPRRLFGEKAIECVRQAHAIAEEWLAGPAEASENGLQNRAMIEDGVRPLPGRHQRGDDEGGNAYAVGDRLRPRNHRARSAGAAIAEHHRPHADFRGRRNHMIVKSSVLVIGDQEQRLAPEVFVAAQLGVDVLQELLPAMHVGDRVIVILRIGMHGRIDDGDCRQVAGLDVLRQPIDPHDVGCVGRVAREEAQHRHRRVGFIDAPTDALARQDIEDCMRPRHGEIVAMIVVENRFATAVILNITAKREHAIGQGRPGVRAIITLRPAIVVGEMLVEGEIGVRIIAEDIIDLDLIGDRRTDPIDKIAHETRRAVDARAAGEREGILELLGDIGQAMADMSGKARFEIGRIRMNGRLAEFADQLVPDVRRDRRLAPGRRKNLIEKMPDRLGPVRGIVKLFEQRGRPSVRAGARRGLAEIAEDMVERSVLHHHHDDMIDLRQIAGRPVIAERRWPEFHDIGSEYFRRATDRGAISLSGFRSGIGLHWRVIVEHQIGAREATRPVGEVIAEQHCKDMGHTCADAVQEALKATGYQIVQSTFDVLNDRNHGDDRERPQHQAGGDRRDDRIGRGVDVEWRVAHPGLEREGPVGTEFEADLHLEAVVADLGIREAEALIFDLAGSLDADRDLERRHRRSEVLALADRNVDRADLHAKEVEDETVPEIPRAVREIIYFPRFQAVEGLTVGLYHPRQQFFQDIVAIQQRCADLVQNLDPAIGPFAIGLAPYPQVASVLTDHIGDAFEKGRRADPRRGQNRCPDPGSADRRTRGGQDIERPQARVRLGVARAVEQLERNRNFEAPVAIFGDDIAIGVAQPKPAMAGRHPDDVAPRRRAKGAEMPQIDGKAVRGGRTHRLVDEWRGALGCNGLDQRC